MNKYIISSLIAILAIFASCTEKYEALTLDEIKVSSSYVALPLNRGKATIELTTSGDYTITGMPEWLTVTPTSGVAGTSIITFEADTTRDGRSTENVRIKVGEKEQIINVIQGLSIVPDATCAEVIAGPDGKTFRTKGVVTSIENTQYGNFYINDGTGKVYIYGTLFEGKTQNNPIVNNNIEVGDEVTVEGPKKTYGDTKELVDVTVIKVSKSLIKVDSLSTNTLPKEGGEFTAYVTCKGDGVNVEAPAEWIAIKSIKSTGTNAEIIFKVAANDGGARKSTLTLVTTKGGKTYTSVSAIEQEGAVLDVTCAQFNALEDGTAQYKIHGIITSIANKTKGYLYINDGTGEVYVFGITDWNADDYKVGDEVTLQSVKTSYKGTPEMKDAVVIEKKPHEVKTVAELKSLADDKNTYYLVTGKVCHAEEPSAKFDLETFGNFGLQDETGTIYVYGVTDALDGVTKNFAATGVKEGDTITILAYKTSYKDTIELVGKFIKKESAE